MATKAQINANRANAQKSTGPKTLQGKAKIAQNATKHGLTSSATLITGEDPADFQLHREALLADLAPQGALQQLFAERIVSLSWRLNRAVRIQGATMDAMIERTAANPYSKLPEKLCEMTPEDANTAIGRSTAGYSENSKTLDRLLLYERRIEQSLYKALHHLERLQADDRRPKPEARHECHSERSATCHSERAQRVEESMEHSDSPQATCLTRSLPSSLSKGLRPACSFPHPSNPEPQDLKKQTQSSNPAPATAHPVIPAAATRHSERSEESIENTVPIADRPATRPRQNQLEKTNPISPTPQDPNPVLTK